jgi:hypothetical protein
MTAPLRQFHGVSTLFALVFKQRHLSIPNHSRLLQDGKLPDIPLFRPSVTLEQHLHR